MGTLKEQQNILIHDETYHDRYSHKIWSCSFDVPTFSHSNLCLKIAQNIQKYGNVFKKGNFVLFCCHGNAINLKLLLCFLSCWVY